MGLFFFFSNQEFFLIFWSTVDKNTSEKHGLRYKFGRFPFFFFANPEFRRSQNKWLVFFMKIIVITFLIVFANNELIYKEVKEFW